LGFFRILSKYLPLYFNNKLNTNIYILLVPYDIISFPVNIWRQKIFIYFFEIRKSHSLIYDLFIRELKRKRFRHRAFRSRKYRRYFNFFQYLNFTYYTAEVDWPTLSILILPNWYLSLNDSGKFTRSMPVHPRSWYNYNWKYIT